MMGHDKNDEDQSSRKATIDMQYTQWLLKEMPELMPDSAEHMFTSRDLVPSGAGEIKGSTDED